MWKQVLGRSYKVQPLDNSHEVQSEEEAELDEENGQMEAHQFPRPLEEQDENEFVEESEEVEQRGVPEQAPFLGLKEDVEMGGEVAAQQGGDRFGKRGALGHAPNNNQDDDGGESESDDGSGMPPSERGEEESDDESEEDEEEEEEQVAKQPDPDQQQQREWSPVFVDKRKQLWYFVRELVDTKGVGFRAAFPAMLRRQYYMAIERKKRGGKKKQGHQHHFETVRCVSMNTPKGRPQHAECPYRMYVRQDPEAKNVFGLYEREEHSDECNRISKNYR